MTQHAYVVHTHYVAQRFAPAEVVIVPLTEWRPFGDQSPTPPDREPIPANLWPSTFWGRVVRHTDESPESLAAHLADWHGIDASQVVIGETVP